MISMLNAENRQYILFILYWIFFGYIIFDIWEKFRSQKTNEIKKLSRDMFLNEH